MARDVFRWIGTLCLAVAAVFAWAGLWTFTFVPVEGEIERLEVVETLASGGYPGVPRVNHSSSFFDDVEVEYRYRVDGKTYRAERVGMGPWPWSLSPFGQMAWERRASADWPAVVYHSPRWPEVAVLHRGIDPVVVAALTFMGLALRRFSRWMETAARADTARSLN